MNTPVSLRVDLPRTAPDRSYDILIGSGLLTVAGTEIAARMGSRRCLIISEETVAGLYLQVLRDSLRLAGHTVLAPIVIPPGENSKNFMTFAAMTEHALSLHPDRQTLIIALGGGVIGDIAGFLAATLLRGLDFVQIPTTLLAQVDSSVGGKTGIDSAHGKNLVGAFHQPRLVLADIATLRSLPQRQLRAGFAETVKYGLIDRPDFFGWCEKNGASLLTGDPTLLQEAVTQSCAAKSTIVATDEKESGRRALLNLGHSFGHALEAVAGFGDTLYHGEAVAIGCGLALRYSVAEGYCPAQDLTRYEALCRACDLPTQPEVTTQDIPKLMYFMAGDKKNSGGKITLILARGIGQAFIAKNIDAASVENFWQKILK
ncbi:MAG: 3-dehydroquinate synthase [Alphaproteobacteria bacterium]